jgi:hypothetical protein
LLAGSRGYREIAHCLHAGLDTVQTYRRLMASKRDKYRKTGRLKFALERGSITIVN